LLAIEATKTKLAGEIGKDSGLFYVPQVLNFDQDRGLLDLERLSGLVTLLQLAIDKDARLLELSEKAGQSLAVIHEQLILPDEMKHELPPEWMAPDSNGSSDQNVFIHGDFGCGNVCFHEPSGQLVILDWSAAPLLGRRPTFGSRYFDILWFMASMFCAAPARKVLSWNAERIVNAFIRRYAESIPGEKLDRFRDYSCKIRRLQKKNICYLAQRRPPLAAILYIFFQVFMYARLCAFLCKYE